MKAKEFIIELKKESKPRNFVAKNASLAGKAGQHKDKKKAEKQGDVKHKKELATMESQGVAEGSGQDYQVGDQVLTHVGSRWIPAIITKPINAAGNYGVKFKVGSKVMNYVSSPDQLKKQGVAEGSERGGTYSPEAIKIANYFIKEFNLTDEIEQQLTIEIVDNVLESGQTNLAFIKKQVIKYLRQSGTIVQSRKQGMAERVRDPEDWDEGNTEPPNNFAVYINGKKWKVFKGRGQYADDQREQAHYQQLKDWAAKKSASTGKQWTVSITGETATESVEEASKMPFAGAKVGHKEGPAGQWRNDGAKKNKPAKSGDLVGGGM